MKARTASLRPTARMLYEAEMQAAGRWSSGRCPDRALVGIAFGVSEIANAEEEARRRIGSRAP